MTDLLERPNPASTSQRRSLWPLRASGIQKKAILGIAVAIVAFLATTPLIFLVFRGLFEDGFSLGNLSAAGAIRPLPQLIFSTGVFTVGTVLLAAVVGTTLAYLHERTDIRFKGVIFFSALVPLVIPNILYTIAWIFIASPRAGLLNGMLEQSFGVLPLDIFSMTGMIWVEGTNLSSLVFLVVAASMKSMDPSLEEAAVVAGVPGRKIIQKITIPLVFPAIAGASLLVAMRALGTFETPALLGSPGQVFVFTNTIWLELNRFPANMQRASGLSLWLVGISALLVYVYFARFGGDRARRYQTISGKAFQVRQLQLRERTRRLATAAVLLWILVALALPLVTLLYVALLPTPRLPSSEVFAQMSLSNFAYVLDREIVQRAFRNSLGLAAASATTVMALMAVVAWFLTRTRVRGRWLIDAVSFTPMAIPGLVLGLSILIFYLRLPLPVYGTILILYIAYVTNFLPHGMRYAIPAVMQVGAELEEAAEVSGASWLRMFWKVTLPLMVPGLLAGWVFIASISVRELAASLLLYTQGNEVLGIALWEMWDDGQTAAAAALGVLMTLGLVLLVALARFVGGKAALSGV